MSFDFAGDAEDDKGYGSRSNTDAEVGGIRIDREIANERTSLENMC